MGECFFWYQLTRVLSDKIQRAVKQFACVCMCSPLKTDIPVGRKVVVYCHNFTEHLCSVFIAVCRNYPSVKTSSGEIVIGLPHERSMGSGQLQLLTYWYY